MPKQPTKPESLLFLLLSKSIKPRNDIPNHWTWFLQIDVVHASCGWYQLLCCSRPLISYAACITILTAFGSLLLLWFYVLVTSLLDNSNQTQKVCERWEYPTVQSLDRNDPWRLDWNERNTVRQQHSYLGMRNSVRVIPGHMTKGFKTLNNQPSNLTRVSIPSIKS